MTATETSTVTLRDDGYLLIPSVLAETRFPNGAVFVTLRDGEMWLMPTSGAGAGGFLLKRRNAVGDRAVLVLEAVPPGTAPGDRDARWDGDACALRVALDPD